MIVKKRLRKNRLWQRVVACLVMVGIVCLFGPVANAHVSSDVYAKLNGLGLLDDQEPLRENPIRLLAKKKGFGNMPPEAKSHAREWNEMSPEEQQRYQQRYRKLQKMSPKERKRYEKWHEQWKKLSPAEREQIRQKLERQNELSPQEVDTIRRRFKN